VHKKRTRFAPSPTGLLHTGNAYSALQCEQWAQQQQAELLLRIEDIDFTRCRPPLAQHICNDLAWLGISFDGDVCYQQQRLHHYQQALDQLQAMGVLYPCVCTRKQIQSRLQSQGSLALDPYPRTCQRLGINTKCIPKNSFSWRLNQEKVEELIGNSLFWSDFAGKYHFFDLQSIGDVIIGRKDIMYSYHLSVVVDDCLQGISHVIRGEDLRSSTPIHRILQLLLGYPSPVYKHHALLQDDLGQRLAKSKQSTSLQALRASGLTAHALREQLEQITLQA